MRGQQRAREGNGHSAAASTRDEGLEGLLSRGEGTEGATLCARRAQLVMTACYETQWRTPSGGSRGMAW